MINKIKGKIKKIAKSILISQNIWYKSQFPYCEKFWRKFPFNLDVVNLGSNSGLFGFRYDDLPIKGANWALSPQSLNQDLAILKTYCSYIRPRGTILVPLGPYSSCLKSYTDTEWMKYFTILHPGVTPNFTIEKQRQAYDLKNHPYRVAPKQMFKGLYHTFKRFIKIGKEPLEYEVCPMTSAQIEQNAQTFIDGWKKQFNISDMDAPLTQHILEGRKQRVETLKEIISFCKEHDFNMYIVLPPITKALSQKFSPTFRENYIYSFIREVGLPSDHVLDYLDDSQFQNNKHFYNSLFLNKAGGKLFTKQVLEDL